MPILFDVADIVETTQSMLDTFQAPEICAFEPSPSRVESLRRAVGNRAGLTVEVLAMGDAEGILSFHVAQDYSVNDSLLSPTWNADGSVVEVRVDTVDNYCPCNGIEPISLLKIDAQGYDLHVLRGTRRMFHDRRIKLFSCEVNFDSMYTGQTALRDLLAFGDEVEYKLAGFYEQTYFTNRQAYLDILFVAA